MPWEQLRHQPKYPKFRVLAIPAIGGIPSSTWQASLEFPQHHSMSDSSIFRDLEDEAYIHFYTFPIGSLSKTLEQCSEDLLESLQRIIPVDNTSQRLHIHFAAYSTGGVVLKRAMGKAKERLPDDVVDCFHSVAFFGVPHHGSRVISDAAFLNVERLQDILHTNQPMPGPMRAQFTEEKNILEQCNASFLGCARSLRKIWNFVEKRDTQLRLPTPGEADPPIHPASMESRACAWPIWGRIVEPQSAAFSAGHNRLYNETTVCLDSNHACLSQFRDSSAQACFYLEGLKSFTVEFDFKVDVHSFSSGETNHFPFHAMPSMTELLRDGPLTCLKKKCLAVTLQNDNATESSGQADDGSPPWQPGDTSRPRLRSRRRSTKTSIRGPEDLLESGLRWIHVPCNHMAWVPEVLHAAAQDSVRNDPVKSANVEAPVALTEPLLDWNSWESKQNVPTNGLPHARFMEPYCQAFPPKKMMEYFEEEQVIQSQSTSDGIQLVLYMPYLHWDTYENLQARNAIINRVTTKANPQRNRGTEHLKFKVRKQQTKDADASKQYLSDVEFAKKYLAGKRRRQVMYRLLLFSNNMPLHPRRSLDQYGHPFLEDISDQDGGQILYKCAQLPYLSGQNSRDSGKDTEVRHPPGPVLMVDQLWCWIVDSSTVVTFFSGTDEVLENLKDLRPGKKDKADEQVDPADVRRHIYERLTNHPRIPSECKTPFDLACVIVLSCVSALLGHRVKSEESLSRRDLDVLGRFEEYISCWNGNQIKQCRKFEEMHRHVKLDFRVKMDDTFDTAGYIELLDAKDELQMLSELTEQQHAVIDRLQEFYTCKYRYENGIATGTDMSKHPHRLLKTAWKRIEKYKAELNRLKEASDSARDSYKTLFDMKQVQANLYEALYAGEANRIMLVFTIVTVVFSPLSFFTSLFGMNIQDWTGVHQNPRLSLVMPVTFVISGVIIALALFSAFTRYRTTLGRRLSSLVIEREKLNEAPELQETDGHSRLWSVLKLPLKKRARGSGADVEEGICVDQMEHCSS